MPDEIYVLWWDNGEAYEDAYRGLVGLYESEDNVQNVIEERGYTVKKKDYFMKPVKEKHDCALGKYSSLEECMNILKDDWEPLPCEHCQGYNRYLDESSDYSYMFYEKYPLHRAKGV